MQLLRLINGLLEKHPESRSRKLAAHAPIIVPVYSQVIALAVTYLLLPTRHQLSVLAGIPAIVKREPEVKPQQSGLSGQTEDFQRSDAIT